MALKIVLIEDDNDLRETLTESLTNRGFEVLPFSTVEGALEEISYNCTLIISDVRMEGLSGYDLLNELKNRQIFVPVLLMTAYGSIEDAVNAVQNGACDYISKPFNLETLIEKIIKFATKVYDKKIIMEDPNSKKIFNLAKRVASTDATVLLEGESGTGKEVLARYIHDNSTRAKHPFVAVNMAAIPENMLEATLFGYEKGAFTGAYQSMPGKFEVANGSTVLLDEISEMPLTLQTKLLRVLQEREVERLGSKKTIKLDVRVIATTNRDLKQEVASGKFREDLYYRLNVFPIRWLKLSQRKKDIVPLAQKFINEYSSNKFNINLSPKAISVLENYTWPGNVRELQNIIQRAVILSRNNTISTDCLALDLTSNESCENDNKNDIEDNVEQVKSNSNGLNTNLANKEYQLIIDMLIKTKGNKQEAARLLEISPRTLRYKIAKMKKLGITIPVTL